MVRRHPLRVSRTKWERALVSKKRKIVWVGSTPITPITPKERKKLHTLMKKRLEVRQKKYPEVRGKVVDYISIPSTT